MELVKYFPKYKNLAYIFLVATLIEIILVWSAVFIFTIHINVGNQVNANWLLLLNRYANGCVIFVFVAIFSGIAAFLFSIGKWERVISVSGLLIGVSAFWLLACIYLGSSTSYSYELTTSVQYADHSFKVIHAYRSGNEMYQADYLLLNCDLSENDCTAINQFDDFLRDESRSKPIRFYVDSSNNALYIKLGDETKLISQS